MKIPLEAAAMVLVAVIALFFYQQGQLPKEMAEAPIDTLNSGHTTKPEPEVSVRSNVRKQKSATPQRPTGAEKAPAPAPIPAPASSEQQGSEIVSDRPKERIIVKVPPAIEELKKAVPMKESGTLLSSAPHTSVSSAKTESMTDSEKEPMRIILLVEDTADVLAAVEKQVNRLHGEITKKDDVSIVVRLNAEDLEQLLKELQNHGRVDLVREEPPQTAGKMLLRISIVKIPPQ